MRIAIPLEGLNPSGGVRIVTEIANGLSIGGHEVEIIVPDYASISSYAIDDKVKIRVVKAKNKKIFAKLFYRSVLCFRAVHNSDVCVATGYKTPYYIYISKIITCSGVKLAYLIQGYEPISHVLNVKNTWFERRFLYFLAKFSLKLPFTRIAVSTWIKEQIGDASIKVIANGIDLNVFSPRRVQRRSQFVVGVIGSNLSSKGYQIFLQAMREIPLTERSTISVLVASKEAVPLPEGVVATMMSPRNDATLAEFYRQCDVFVYPSMIEGFGLPPLEAMACGVPVIVSDCGGVGMYADSRNSILVRPGDIPELTKAIIKIKRDAYLRAELEENGIRTASRFSVQVMRDAYKKFLEEL